MEHLSWKSDRQTKYFETVKKQIQLEIQTSKLEKKKDLNKKSLACRAVSVSWGENKPRNIT